MILKRKQFIHILVSGLFSILVLNKTVTSTPQHSYSSDVGLNVLELIKKYGYPIERHENIETEDGYLLELHRIPHGSNSSRDIAEKPVVLLIHCFLCSSAEWVYMGPNKSLAYILADQGYDVWLGNNRGNTWSRKHKTLDPDDSYGPFWDYTFHEMGYYDIPAMIDHVLQVTNQRDLYMIGHSQGTTTTFTMLTTRPEYNEKVRLFSAFSPAVYVSGASISRLIADTIWPVFGTILKFFKMNEVLGNSFIMQQFTKMFCSEGSVTQSLCRDVLLSMVGRNPKKFNPDTIPVITTHTPAGSSWKLVKHLQQLVQTDNFLYYDYGEDVNLEKYNSLVPPPYNIENIVAPVALYYGEADEYVSAEGIIRFSKELNNLVHIHKVEDENWTHMDFLWAKDAPVLLYNTTIELMKEF